jgi:hypothetical protein
MSRKYIDEKDVRLYSIWKGMNKRCNNPNAVDYRWYGGKGVKVCEEWHDYLKFRTWALTNGYSIGLTIDRIDTNKGYSPSNCQWLTQSDNSKKRQREGKFQVIEYNGEKHGLRDWSLITGINQTTLQTRIRNGWNVERALTEGVHK